MRRGEFTLGLLCALGVLCGSPAGRATEARLNPSTAHLLAATEDWLLWQTHDLVAATRQDRAPSYVIRFYRQRVSDDRAALIWETTDTLVPWLATVLKSGTALLCARGGLIWVSPVAHPPSGVVDAPAGAGAPHGTAVSREDPVLERRPVVVLALYPDGAAVQVRGTNLLAFVPVKADGDGPAKPAERLDWDGRIALPADESPGKPLEPVFQRHGDLLAWIWGSRLHVFNLTRRSGRASSPVRHPGDQLYAFDGQTAVATADAFDTATGRILAADAYYPIFAVRHRIGYYFRAAGGNAVELCAVDLDSAGSQPAVLKRLRNYRVYAANGASVGLADLAAPSAGYRENVTVALPRSSGLRVWDGAAWSDVPWLETVGPSAPGSPREGQPPQQPGPALSQGVRGRVFQSVVHYDLRTGRSEVGTVALPATLYIYRGRVAPPDRPSEGPKGPRPGPGQPSLAGVVQANPDGRYQKGLEPGTYTLAAVIGPPVGSRSLRREVRSATVEVEAGRWTARDFQVAPGFVW